MDYYSNVGYSLKFMRWQLLGFCIVLLILIFFPMIIFGLQLYFISLFFLIFGIIILIIGFLLMKFVLGIRAKIEGNEIIIYRANSFALNPKQNELYFIFGKSLGASVRLTKDNIIKVRKIDDIEEVKQITKINNIISVSQIAFIRTLMNKSNVEKLSFVSDYDKMIEITVKTLKITWPSGFTQTESYTQNNVKILISVKNPDEFIMRMNNK